MMTPTAIIEFNFEVLFENGEKIRTEVLTNQHGAYDACEYLKAHGVNVSYSTVLNSKNERMYKVTKLPYHAATTEKEAVEVFNNVYGQVSKVVDLLIVVKRIK